MKKRVNRDNKHKFRLEHWHIVAILLVVYDIMAVNISYFLALWLRFDGVFSGIPKEYLKPYISFIPIYTVISVLIFFFIKMYHSVWKFAGSTELFRTVIGSLAASAAHIVLITVLFKRMPISYYLWGTGFQLILLVVARFSYRFMVLESRRFKSHEKNTAHSRVMIVGAGDAGQMILRSILKNDNRGDRVVCFIDDNPNTRGRYFDGIPVVGSRDDILLNVEKHQIDKIYIAMPSAPREAVRDIINICSETNCEVKNLPDFYQYANSGISVDAMRNISVEDLLGREPIRTEMSEVYDMIRGKVILVTGGGGSIGSELCRQIAAHKPKKLIIFEIYENNAYAIQQELAEERPELSMEVLIGSVRDSRRLDEVFGEYRPDIVYHAAAHKHVPLMEDSPCEAVKNNVIGTYKTAYAAMMNGCKRFVLISTDKAVNPTNVMGASKRLCEMVVQTFDRSIKENKIDSIPRLFTHAEDGENGICRELSDNIDTEFVAVRFGNVLGSNGSVVPLFKHQIEKGGPVKVTHPDIIRYFMTIPEAVSLVLLAGTYAHGGEIFVLDMGSPVKIDTLARNLIKLSGLKPDEDIKIEYTGLRPGEKLYEEKLMSEEGLKTTPNKLIHIGEPIPIDADRFRTDLEKLMTSAYDNNADIRSLISEMVPTYKPKSAEAD